MVKTAYDDYTIDEQDIIDSYLVRMTRSYDAYLCTAARFLLRSHQPTIPESPPVCPGQMRVYDLL